MENGPTSERSFRVHGEPGDSNPPQTLQWAAFSFAVDRVSAEAITALREASIPSILVKGPAIATWLYSGDRPRLYTDTDLLLRKQDWEGAKAVMEQLGFEDDLGPLAHPRMESGEGYPWGRPNGAGVDLHYTLFGVGADPDALWASFSEDAVREAVGGIEVSMPSHPARLLHIALHVVQHGGNEQLKPMMDLEHALAKAPRDLWSQAWDVAQRVEAEEAFTAGLRLHAKGRQLADAIGARHHRTVDTALRLNWVPTAEGFKELAEASGFRQKSAIVTRELFPSTAFMRWWSPLARRGPLGLALAYAWRPLWLAAKVVPGYRTWRRASRAATSEGEP